MNLIFLIAAESVSVDQSTNRLSLFNVADEMLAPAFPTVIPTLSVVALITRETGEEAGPASLRVRPNDETLIEGAIPLAFQDKLKTRAMITVQGLAIAAAGTLNCEVLFGQDIAGTWKITIGQLAAQA